MKPKIRENVFYAVLLIAVLLLALFLMNRAISRTFSRPTEEERISKLEEMNKSYHEEHDSKCRSCGRALCFNLIERSDIQYCPFCGVYSPFVYPWG